MTGDKKVFTWNEMVETGLIEMLEKLAGNSNPLEKMMYKVVDDRAREFFDSISLARIASALYKIADMKDEVTENFFEKVEELAKDE